MVTLSIRSLTIVARLVKEGAPCSVVYNTSIFPYHGTTSDLESPEAGDRFHAAEAEYRRNLFVAFDAIWKGLNQKG